MSNITYYLNDSYIKKNGQSPIVLRLHVNGRKFELKTGVAVESRFWDKKKKFILPEAPDANDSMMLLGQCFTKANEIYIKYRLAENEITAAKFKDEYLNPSSDKDLYLWLENEIRSRLGVIEPSTIAMHNSLLNSLRGFRSHVAFSDLDCKFLEDFEYYMKNQEKNGLNTQSKKFRALKAYLNRAVERNIIKANPFSKYRIKKGKNRIIFLAEDELIKLISLYYKELAPEKYKKVLKYFLASCFTGLRISDIKRFKWEWIQGEMIILRPKKLSNVNNEYCEIPVTESLAKLIGYKKGIERSGLIFDCFTDQASSRYVKEAGKLAGIKKDISFHTSRHTFASLFLEKTGDIATLQKLLGHSNIQQTMVYAHTTDRKKRQQMALFNETFSHYLKG